MRFHQDAFGEPSVTQTRAIACATKASPMRAYGIPIHLFRIILLELLSLKKVSESAFNGASKSFIGGSYTSEARSFVYDV